MLATGKDAEPFGKIVLEHKTTKGPAEKARAPGHQNAWNLIEIGHGHRVEVAGLERKADRGVIHCRHQQAILIEHPKDRPIIWMSLSAS